jgi:hypothetical protein
MFSVGGLRVISAIVYFADSNKIHNVTGGLFGGQLFWWGVWDLIIAALALFAGYSLLSGDMFGRVVAYAWAVLVIIQSFLLLGYSPWFGLAAMTLAVIVVYAVSTTSEWTER